MNTVSVSPGVGFRQVWCGDGGCGGFQNSGGISGELLNTVYVSW
jgi:hypothetical protein